MSDKSDTTETKANVSAGSTSGEKKKATTKQQRTDSPSKDGESVTTTRDTGSEGGQKSKKSSGTSGPKKTRIDGEGKPKKSADTSGTEGDVLRDRTNASQPSTSESGHGLKGFFDKLKSGSSSTLPPPAKEDEKAAKKPKGEVAPQKKPPPNGKGKKTPDKNKDREVAPQDTPTEDTTTIDVNPASSSPIPTAEGGRPGKADGKSARHNAEHSGPGKPEGAHPKEKENAVDPGQQPQKSQKSDGKNKGVSKKGPAEDATVSEDVSSSGRDSSDQASHDTPGKRKRSGNTTESTTSVDVGGGDGGTATPTEAPKSKAQTGTKVKGKVTTTKPKSDTKLDGDGIPATESARDDGSKNSPAIGKNKSKAPKGKDAAASPSVDGKAETPESKSKSRLKPSTGSDSAPPTSAPTDKEGVGEGEEEHGIKKLFHKFMGSSSNEGHSEDAQSSTTDDRPTSSTMPEIGGKKPKEKTKDSAKKDLDATLTGERGSATSTERGSNSSGTPSEETARDKSKKRAPRTDREGNVTLTEGPKEVEPANTSGPPDSTSGQRKKKSINSPSSMSPPPDKQAPSSEDTDLASKSVPTPSPTSKPKPSSGTTSSSAATTPAKSQSPSVKESTSTSRKPSAKPKTTPAAKSDEVDSHTRPMVAEGGTGSASADCDHDDFKCMRCGKVVRREHLSSHTHAKEELRQFKETVTPQATSDDITPPTDKAIDDQELVESSQPSSNSHTATPKSTQPTAATRKTQPKPKTTTTSSGQTPKKSSTFRPTSSAPAPSPLPSTTTPKASPSATAPPSTKQQQAQTKQGKLEPVVNAEPVTVPERTPAPVKPETTPPPTQKQKKSNTDSANRDAPSPSVSLPSGTPDTQSETQCEDETCTECHQRIPRRCGKCQQALPS